MSQKIIFMDIDGTLTKPGSNEPPVSAQKAVRLARQKGHKIFLCTGRNYGMLKPLLAYGFDGVIASSGGYIEYEGKVIYDCPMEETQKEYLMKVLEENGIFRTVECRESSYTDEGFKEFLKKNAHQGGNSELLRWREQIEQSLKILPMKEYQNQPVYKMVIMCEKEEQLALPRQIFEKEIQFCIQEADQYGFINGEVLNRKFDKGQALKRVCEHLGVSVQDTFAFGDSMNDVEMMETAGFGICMENGSQTLKNLADAICPAVTEDGIYHAFLKYGFI